MNINKFLLYCSRIGEFFAHIVETFLKGTTTYGSNRYDNFEAAHESVYGSTDCSQNVEENSKA